MYSVLAKIYNFSHLIRLCMSRDLCKLTISFQCIDFRGSSGRLYIQMTIIFNVGGAKIRVQVIPNPDSNKH